jgi:hypothetical protein
VTIAEWATDTARRVRTDGLRGVSESWYELYVGSLRRVNCYYPLGCNVFDREWDLLVLLDGCRVDLIEEVAPAHPFLGSPGTLTSVGSSSLDWLVRTFTPKYAGEFDRCAYVTGNPFSYRVLAEDDLLVLDEVWRYAWDDEQGTIPPRPITDRAIATAHEQTPDRLIVHYMQPHLPSIPKPLSSGMNRETLGQGRGWESPWKQLRRGELEFDVVWEAYRANLEYVLEDVELLLENVEASNAIISADHGNAAGEFGIFGHPRVPLGVIREVPWYETSGTDTDTYQPTLEPVATTGEVEEKLEALGYL